MAEVRIDWEDENCHPSEVTDSRSGIYLCTGIHPVYSDEGLRVLLYIGAADNFKKDISEHGFFEVNSTVPDIFEPELIRVRLGLVDKPKNVDLALIAGLLVFVHAPAWNHGKCVQSTLRDYYDNKRGKREYYGLTIHNCGQMLDGLLPTVYGSQMRKA